MKGAGAQRSRDLARRSEARPMWRRALPRAAACFLLVYGCANAQAPRDLHYERDEARVESATLARTVNADSDAPPGLPKGYALVIGVGTYPGMDAKANLEFAERDAEAMYATLISPEGGNFKAENVH